MSTVPERWLSSWIRSTTSRTSARAGHLGRDRPQRVTRLHHHALHPGQLQVVTARPASNGPSQEPMATPSARVRTAASRRARRVSRNPSAGAAAHRLRTPGSRRRRAERASLATAPRGPGRGPPSIPALGSTGRQTPTRDELRPDGRDRRAYISSTDRSRPRRPPPAVAATAPGPPRRNPGPPAARDP